jgi:hypothetical protein
MTWPFAVRQDLNLKKMGSRMLKAARLDGETYKELRDDPSATLQSVFLVAIIGLCYGAGLGLFRLFVAGISVFDILIITAIGLVSAIVISIVWSVTTFLIVAKLFRGKITYWGLTRPFFFSWTPGLLFILMSVPNPTISEIVRASGAAWIIIAGVFTVKHAAGFSIQQSMLTFIICTLILLFILSILSMS